MENKDCCNKNKNGMIISIVIFILLAQIAYFGFYRGSGNSGLPSYALKNKDAKEAYLFATENPEALDGVKCHCGCMEVSHEGRLHSRGLLDCFRNGEKYDSHGAGCNMCVYDSLEVKKLASEGKSKEDIKRIIDEKYI